MTDPVVPPTEGRREAHYGWGEYILPCDHPVQLHRLTDGRKVPIGLGPYPGRSASVWCPHDGWVKVTDEQFNEVKEVSGGIA